MAWIRGGFSGFAPDQLAGLTTKQADSIEQDRRTIRNPQKIKAVFDDAQSVSNISIEHPGL